MFICTRSEHEVRRKSGTGEEKERSVPDLSTKSDENRVQEKENSDLYPIRARNRTETGYRKAKVVICTLAEQETLLKNGTGEGKYEKTHRP